MSQSTGSAGVKRREFLKVLGAASAVTTTIGCSQEKVEKLVVRAPHAGVLVGFLGTNMEEEDRPAMANLQIVSKRMVVLPEYRSQGVGKALLAASMRTFADRGCTLAGIGVDTDRPDAAENLFEGMGYVLDDRMVLYGGVFDQ